MATTKRISRKELKQPDEFVSFWAQIFEFAQHHQREILIGVSAVVVLVLLVWAGVIYSRNREATASGMLAQAQSLLKPSNAAIETGPAATAEPAVDAGSKEHALRILEEVVEDYGRTQACRVGRILLGQLYYERGDYDKAISTYEGFLTSRDRKPELTAMAWEGLAYSHEAKKEFAEALAAYEKLSESAVTSVQGWAYMGIARCSEKLGKNEEALEAYRSLVANHPQHPEAQEARASIARITQSLERPEPARPDPEPVPESTQE